MREELKQEMQALKGADEATIYAKLVEFGKKHGFEFIVEDLKALNSQLTEDLSDEELENINGGLGTAVSLAALFVVIVGLVISGVNIEGKR